MASCHFLITGFGPFPGVPDNTSARLIESLARRRVLARLGCPVEAVVLPTEWTQVALLAPALLRRHNPRLVLHFGVSDIASGFRIERAAHNRIARRPDASGLIAGKRKIQQHGNHRLMTRIPVPELAKHMRKQGLSAITSSSAGSYVCNFLYYLTLDWASRQHAADACFVHIPHANGRGGPMSEEDLLRGAESVLGYLLAFAEARDRTPSDGAVRGAALRAGQGSRCSGPKWRGCAWDQNKV